MSIKQPTSQTALSDKLGEKAVQPSREGLTVKSLISSEAIKKRFEQVLDKRAPQFLSSIINLVNSEKGLQGVDQMSVITSCMVAATLDLPVDKNLGYAWIVPYSGRAQFQMGYKGYIQLALRTGQYRFINAISIHDGELFKWNKLTEELVIDFEKRKTDQIIGYAGYFELLNGFRKTVYWTSKDIEIHKKKFSKSDFGWVKDYDAMALKTVIRNMLSKWGILSIDMQTAYSKEIDTHIENGSDDKELIEVGDWGNELEEGELPANKETAEFNSAIAQDMLNFEQQNQ